MLCNLCNVEFTNFNFVIHPCVIKLPCILIWDQINSTGCNQVNFTVTFCLLSGSKWEKEDFILTFILRTTFFWLNEDRNVTEALICVTVGKEWTSCSNFKQFHNFSKCIGGKSIQILHLSKSAHTTLVLLLHSSVRMPFPANQRRFWKSLFSLRRRIILSTHHPSVNHKHIWRCMDFTGEEWYEGSSFKVKYNSNFITAGL